MSPESVPAAPRSTAEERRRQLIEAAVPAFAAKGLHGTAVSEVTVSPNGPPGPAAVTMVTPPARWRSAARKVPASTGVLSVPVTANARSCDPFAQR